VTGYKLESRFRFQQGASRSVSITVLKSTQPNMHRELLFRE
jgi:hypothetical protein